jgi:conjugal transfer pilus assembly protein TraB
MASNPLKEKWEALDPDKRQQLIKGGAIAGAVVVGLVLYYGSGQDSKGPAPPPKELEVIDVGENRLQDDIRAQVMKERGEMDQRQTAQEKQLRDQRETLQRQEAQLEAMRATVEAMSKGGALGLPSTGAGPSGNPDDWQQGVTLPAQPARAGGPGAQPGPQPIGPNGVPAVEVIEMVGGVGRITPTSVVEDEKKNESRFYLPVSFMQARILTGLRAKTAGSASGNPEPMLLRVQAPAILPNELRSNLEGCLVVAQGYGDLSSERVETSLVSINCLDHSGQSIIEEEITGIVVDRDGVKGLAAHPVSKMGANLARLALAGAVQGAGDAFSEQAETVTISPLGQTSTIDPSQVGRAGLGQGVSQASEAYAEIIADLVRQQAPVLEMGAGKEVVVALTQGVWLNVRSTLE